MTGEHAVGGGDPFNWFARLVSGLNGRPGHPGGAGTGDHVSMRIGFSSARFTSARVGIKECAVRGTRRRAMGMVYVDTRAEASTICRASDRRDR